MAVRIGTYGAAELAAELWLGNLYSHPGTCCSMLLLQQVLVMG